MLLEQLLLQVTKCQQPFTVTLWRTHTLAIKGINRQFQLERMMLLYVLTTPQIGLSYKKSLGTKIFKFTTGVILEIIKGVSELVPPIKLIS